MTLRAVAITSCSVAISVAMVSCDAGTPDHSRARREIAAALQRYQVAARSVDANAMSASFTTDGVLFEPGIRPIVTRDSIRAFLKSFPGARVHVATATPDTIDVFGKRAYLWGSYFEHLSFPGQPTSEQHGKFVSEWVQQPDEQWLIARLYRIPLPPIPSIASVSAVAPRWVMTERGIGALRTGMSVEEARALVPSFTTPPGTAAGSCHYAGVKGMPDGTTVMVESGRIGRIDVDRGEMRTAAGARIGDTEERVKALYPNRVRVSPHKYTSGHYLTVSASSPADSAYRTIFETDGNRVLSYRVGIRPQVEYVERCG